jgi:predicted TIM-barrel fold metal-dependent hydrolase
MKIVDAQVHIWRQTVSQPTGKHRKVSLVSAEQMLKEMDEAGVDAALIHPPLWANSIPRTRPTRR